MQKIQLLAAIFMLGCGASEGTRGGAEDAKCISQTSEEFCAAIGANCGAISGVDNCGVQRDVICSAACNEECHQSEPKNDNVPSFRDSEYVATEFMVKSKASGLIWQRHSSTDKYNWKEAENYCAELNLGGCRWRLPTYAELSSLIDPYTGSPPYINTQVFPDTKVSNETFHWTATKYSDPINNKHCGEENEFKCAWYVNFSGAMSSANGVEELGHVRCVQ